MECLITHFPSFLLKAVILPTETVPGLSSNSFHKFTTLALQNFCPNVPFLFLNNLYICPRITLLGANSTNITHCMDSYRRHINWCIFFTVLCMSLAAIKIVAFLQLLVLLSLFNLRTSI